MDAKSHLLAQCGGLEYKEKISLLNEDDYFSLFSRLNAAPRYVNSAGKRSIQILGLHTYGGFNKAEQTADFSVQFDGLCV